MAQRRLARRPKVAGILVEARQDPGWAVLGIGVNVAVDVDRAARRTRPRSPARSGKSPDDVEPTLPRCSTRSSAAWPGPRSTLAALRERDALLGRPVRWQDGEGTGAGIDDDGALRVTLDDGSTTTLSAGEVTLTQRDA